MPEVLLPCAAACLLLAAASHRHRRDSGALWPGQRHGLRAAAAALLLLALWLAAAPLTGERVVRFLAGFALGGLAVVLALSFAPARTLAPVRALLARRDQA